MNMSPNCLHSQMKLINSQQIFKLRRKSKFGANVTDSNQTLISDMISTPFFSDSKIRHIIFLQNETPLTPLLFLATLSLHYC